ncbi:hypothetical protein ACGFWI_37645 [Streptomyces sp. NPDC048434]|uniref:hypothetical protein n=1 Tax=Streptomyces sp. NPDC048434 TaxID=3365549 RepID=UPI00371A78A7
MGLFAVGVGEIKSATGVAALPETIKTFADLANVLKTGYKLVSGTAAAGSRSAEAVAELAKLQNNFKEKSATIKPGECKTIHDTGFLDYLNASTVAAMFAPANGARTVEVIAMTESGKVVDFSTPPDASWISTDAGVVRSKYGTLRDEDPGAGNHPWASY